MLAQAKAKLQTEMDGNKSNSYIQVVGNFLLQHLETDTAAAEKIMTADKTIAKSLEEMRRAAEKVKVGNMAVLTDAEGFAVVLKYFDIKLGKEVPAATAPAPMPKPVAEFDISLDDLL